MPVVGLSLVAAVIAYVTGIEAARRLGARVASFVGLAEVLFAIVFAWVLLDQRPIRAAGRRARSSSWPASPWSAADDRSAAAEASTACRSPRTPSSRPRDRRMNDGPPAGARRVSVPGVPPRAAGWPASPSGTAPSTTVHAARASSRLTGADGARAWLEVPFPPLDRPARRARAAASAAIGVLLVRRGGHAAGVFDGDALVASKVGSSYVQGGTKAGGWSQQRYARRRANQADAAFADAADAAARVLLDPARPIAGARAGRRPAGRAGRAGRCRA